MGDHLGQIYQKRGEKDRALRTYALSMNGLRPTPETRSRLASLAGGDAKADAAVARYKDELQHHSTIDLGKATQMGNADFFILLSGGGGSPAKVDAVKFVSGDEKLKSFTAVLKTADYHLTFPDDTKSPSWNSLLFADHRKVIRPDLPDDVRTGLKQNPVPHFRALWREKDFMRASKWSR